MVHDDQPGRATGAPPVLAGSFPSAKPTMQGGTPLPIEGHNKNTRIPAASPAGMQDSQMRNDGTARVFGGKGPSIQNKASGSSGL